MSRSCEAKHRPQHHRLILSPQCKGNTTEARETEDAAGAGTALRDAEGEADRVAREANPCLGEVAVLEGLILSEASALEEAQQQSSTWDSEAGWLGELDSAFGRTGVQSFALEGILGELQVSVPLPQAPNSSKC